MTNANKSCTIQHKEAKRTTKKKGGNIIIALGEVLSVSRGLHLLDGERNSDNLENEGISRAKILTFSDVREYNYMDINTIRPDGERVLKNGKEVKRERTEVFVNLSRRYKNAKPQRFDVILPLKASVYCPRMIYWEDENMTVDCIYANDIVFLRRNTERIEPKFIFYIMNSTKVREYLNAESEKQNPKRISCSMIEEIKLELPDVNTQREIIRKVSENELNIENLIG